MKRLLTVLVVFLVGPTVLFGTETFRLASIFSQTGTAAMTNLHQIRTVELAVEEINRNGGVLGSQIELFSYDNESSALGSILAAKNAVADEVSAVIGASWSSHSLAMAPVFQEAGIPMLTPSSTNTAVTGIGDYIFRVCFVDSFQGEVAAKFAIEDLHVKTAVVLTNTNSTYSLDLAALFIDKFSNYGGNLLWEGDYLEPVDIEEYLAKVKNLKPDLIFIPGYARDSSLFIKSFRTAGIDAYILGGDGWSQNEMYNYARNALDGSYYVSHWYSGLTEPESLEFISKMQNYFTDGTLNPGMALSYDAVKLLITAVQKAKSFKPEDIRVALSKISDFQGVTGKISMGIGGDPEKDAYVLIFEDGKTEFVKKVSP